MALSTHVTDRYGTNSIFLRNLTNHDASGATTVNTTRLGLAADDAEADFVVYGQVAYSDTDAAHVKAGVRGVLAYLRSYSTAPGKASGEIDAFRDELKAIAKVSSRKRVTPTSTSVLTPSTPDTSAGSVRPDFDHEQFDGISPNPPLGDPGTV